MVKSRGVAYRTVIRGIRLFIANLIWVVLSGGRYWAFQKAKSKVEKKQRDILLRIIHRNVHSTFGKNHHFQNIKSVADFQSRVKLSTYDDFIFEINSIARGDQFILTAEQVLRLEPSSGSTASSKFLPYTKSLHEEFRNGLVPWMFDLLTHRKGLLWGSAYWSISPNTPKELTGSKISIGFGDDAGYFGSWEQRLLNEILVVPSSVAKIKDVDTFRYVTLLFLLRDTHLAFISCWNPTFLVLLMQQVPNWMPALLQDIKEGTISPPGSIDSNLKFQLLKKCYPDHKRAEFIKDAWNSPNAFETIWPQLSLISCWADGHARTSVLELKSFFPHVEIQPKGLIATEGMISFPLLGKKGAALSIRSHFYEFIEIDAPGEHAQHADCIKLAHQLEMNRRYSVVITTGGGLYRYQLQDIIQVVGFDKQCPLIQFISKESKVSDLVGEKLNEFHVATALEETFKRYSITPNFYLLAPEKDRACAYVYVLFLEFVESEGAFHNLTADLADFLERRLEENYHYAHAIRLGQLSPIKLFRINESGKASIIYLDACEKDGQRIGQIKPTVLNRNTGWSTRFTGRYI